MPLGVRLAAEDGNPDDSDSFEEDTVKKTEECANTIRQKRPKVSTADDGAGPVDEPVPDNTPDIGSSEQSGRHFRIRLTSR